jgi:D-3-phosphoglycerate dehydrogenase / 2-oxoglutarate reductase
MYIFDFDSTIITCESLDELAAISLRENENKDEILKEITDLTERAMDGSMPFGESLLARIKLIHTNKEYIEKTIALLQQCITPSIWQNKDFLANHKNDIYIVSGGFKEIIIPIVTRLGIDESHIFGNTFVFDKEGKVIDIDRKNPLSKDMGKVKITKQLAKGKEITIIGDGYTDYQVKKAGIAHKFVAFVGNKKRQSILHLADVVADSFEDDLLTNSYTSTTQ